MIDRLVLIADSPQKMAQIGGSLARTIYPSTRVIFLIGEVGAGKTTFLQGFGAALGISDPIQSPTFTLEHRYETPHGVLLHNDLYRLTDAQVSGMAHDDDAFLRCVELAPGRPMAWTAPSVTVTIDDPDGTRTVTVEFHDAKIPRSDEIERWRNDADLPLHVRRHCDTVAAVARQLGDALCARGTIVRPELLVASARVHDLLRFLDFRALPGLPEPTDAQRRTWAGIAKEYPSMSHEMACAEFLLRRGFPEAASIVRTHGVALPPEHEATVEQQLVYYSDKRCNGDTIVAVDERFDDFLRRYGDARRAEADHWRSACHRIETTLFGQHVPTLTASTA